MRTIWKWLKYMWREPPLIPSLFKFKSYIRRGAHSSFLQTMHTERCQQGKQGPCSSVCPEAPEQVNPAVDGANELEKDNASVILWSRWLNSCSIHWLCLVIFRSLWWWITEETLRINVIFTFHTLNIYIRQFTPTCWLFRLQSCAPA